MNDKKRQPWEFLTRPLPSPQSFPGRSPPSRSPLVFICPSLWGCAPELLHRLSSSCGAGAPLQRWAHVLIAGLLSLWTTALHPETGEVWFPLRENATFVCDGLQGPFWF